MQTSFNLLLQNFQLYIFIQKKKNKKKNFQLEHTEFRVQSPFVFGFPLLFCFALAVCLGWAVDPWPRPLPVAPAIVA